MRTTENRKFAAYRQPLNIPIRPARDRLTRSSLISTHAIGTQGGTQGNRVIHPRRLWITLWTALVAAVPSLDIGDRYGGGLSSSLQV